jgi:hypothetical protein
MTRFSGVVTLNEDRVPVMVGLDDDRISLVAGEVKIAEWQSGDYVVVDLGTGTFVIEAEEGSISFHPDDPGSFARGIVKEHDIAPESVSLTSLDTLEIREGPAPKPSTLAAFYVLVVLTAALGIWALLSVL